jgi:hypothetical protein
MTIRNLTRVVNSCPQPPFAQRPSTQRPPVKQAVAQQAVFYGCLLPLFNATAALALGLLVVYSDADRHKVLTGVLSACNVGGWAWWLAGSFRALRWAAERQAGADRAARHAHPGFRLAGLLSAGGALSWVGVLCLLAYGMLG